MKAKIIENRLCCIFSEFEARIIRQLLGSVDSNGNASSETFAAINQMGVTFSNKDVWYIGEELTTGQLLLQPDSAKAIKDAIMTDGWNS